MFSVGTKATKNKPKFRVLLDHRWGEQEQLSKALRINKSTNIQNNWLLIRRRDPSFLYIKVNNSLVIEFTSIDQFSMQISRVNILIEIDFLKFASRRAIRNFFGSSRQKLFLYFLKIIGDVEFVGVHTWR